MIYLAAYLQEGEPFFRFFSVCDDFLHAVEQAEDAREDGEQLVGVLPPIPNRLGQKCDNTLERLDDGKATP